MWLPFGNMEVAYVLADCPECRGVRTVIMDVCSVCFAEFGERADERLDEELAPQAETPGPKVTITQR
jgi:hypothetical protein